MTTDTGNKEYWAKWELAHTHSFTYTVSGATITAKCTAEGCTDPAAAATLTIKEPTLTTYGGTGNATATLDGLTDFNTATGKSIAMTDIKYAGREGTTYAESATAPTDAGKYTAKITVEEKTASVDYEIAKAATTITVNPTASEITYGQTLANSTLTGGTASVAGSFAWKDSTVVPAVSDSQTTEYDVVFTPTNGNYGPAECKVKLTVNKADSAVTKAPTAKTLTYNGKAQELVTAGTAEGGEMQYALGTDDKTAPDAGWSTSIPSKTDAGTYHVWYKIEESVSYNGVSANCVTASIGKKALTVSADAVSKEYGQADPELTYKADGLVSGDALTGALARGAGESVGKYEIGIGTLSAGDNYEISFTPAFFTITKSDADVNAPTTNELTYNGQEQELVKAGTVSGGSILYSLDGSSYGSEIPKAKNAGQYTVYYKVSGDGNHKDVEATQITVTILKKALTITADAKKKACGEADPGLTYQSSGLIEGDKITGALSRTEGENAGTYAIGQGTLTAGDNYDISFTGAVLTIVAADKSSLDSAISEAVKYYDSIKGNEKYKDIADALKKAIDAASAVSAKDALSAAEVADAVKALNKAVLAAKEAIKALPADDGGKPAGDKTENQVTEEKARERAEINKLRIDEIAKHLTAKDNGDVVGMYQTNFDTVSCDIVITKGKITAVVLNKDSIKDGKNYLTFNTGTRIVLGEAYTVSNNFADPKDYKRAKKFVKKKKNDYVLDLKPLRSARGKSYELILVSGKKELIIDVVDVSLNKKDLPKAVLTKEVPVSAVSANAVSENSVGETGFFEKDGVLTISTRPNVKTGIEGRDGRTARFITGVWNVAGQDVVSGGVQTITKGKAKVYAMVKADGTLSIAKAEGSGSGNLAITYVLNGQAKVSNGKVRFKSKVYKAKVKIK